MIWRFRFFQPDRFACLAALFGGTLIILAMPSDLSAYRAQGLSDDLGVETGRGEDVALDGQGFHVDIDVLETAAKAMREIAADQNASELADLCDGDAQTIGNDVMYEALVSFCEKMSEGIDYLVDKAEDTGEGLREAARTYRETDHAATEHLAGDPAAAAMDEHF